MRLLLDENVQGPTLDFLRSLGHDVCSVGDQGLGSLDDPVIFEHACRTQRVLLTYNTDFADIRQLLGKHHSGIVRLRISNQRLAYMHPVLERSLARIADLDLSDTLVTISDKRIRIRNTFSL